MKHAHYLIAMVLSAVAIPVAIAQDNDQHSKKQPHYKLIDIGTFGGPQSYIPPYIGFAIRILNNHGGLIGSADTSQPDPFPNFCFNPGDCFVSHAFRTGEDGELTDLGALPGGGSSAPQWMSRSGLIAGFSENGLTDPLIPGRPELRAVLWQNGGITDLGTLEGGYESTANAVDSKGEVVGMFTNTTPDPNSIFGSGYQTRAFFWQDGVMRDLGTLGGPDAGAFLINERAQVVGWSYVSSVPIFCFGSPLVTLATGSFVWDEESGMRDLGGLGGLCTEAEAINNRGQIVGTSDLKGDAAFHAFIWDGSIHDLGGSLGGNISQGFAVNDAGVAVGFGTLAGDTTWHATLWKGVGKITDLGVVGNDQCSSAHSINAKGQVVGESVGDCTTNAGFRSFLWDDGSIFDLNALIPSGSPLYVQSADTINDRGEIAAQAVDANGNGHAVLLIPCDENQPEVEGCDYSLVNPAAAARENPASARQKPTTTAPRMNNVGRMPRRRPGPLSHLLRPKTGSIDDQETQISRDSAWQLEDKIAIYDREPAADSSSNLLVVQLNGRSVAFL
jgi:probable HAF family extracellular repeat protein